MSYTGHSLGGVLPLCRGAVSVFYSPSWLGNSRQRSYRYCCMDAPLWTLSKRLEKKLDSNYTRMMRAILNKSWRQHPTKHKLYGHLPPITKTIQARRTRLTGHCWRSREELISDILLWTPTYGRAKAGRPARTYIQQLCEDMGCSPEDLPEAMNDREKWRDMVKDIRAGGTTWWWWWWWWWWFHFYNKFISLIQARHIEFHLTRLNNRNKFIM